MIWWMADGAHPDEALGFLPFQVSLKDPRPAARQFAENGPNGWLPLKGFSFDPETETLSYPGDPPMQPIAGAQLREETILVYPHAWVLILQPDGSFEAARLD